MCVRMNLCCTTAVFMCMCVSVCEYVWFCECSCDGVCICVRGCVVGLDMHAYVVGQVRPIAAGPPGSTFHRAWRWIRAAAPSS